MLERIFFFVMQLNEYQKYHILGKGSKIKSVQC